MAFRVRAQDANGDMQFGHGASDFLVDSPAAVGQLVLTRLRLWEGEWYLDLTEGTPYLQSILGKSRQNARDAAIRDRILTTPFVTGLRNYSSSVLNRNLVVTATVITAFGVVPGNVPGSPDLSQFTFGETPLGGDSPLG